MKSQLCLFVAAGIAVLGCSLETPPECRVSDGTRCENNVSIGLLSTCVNGKWETVPCEGYALCKDAQTCSKPKECMPNTTNCSNTREGGLLIHCDQHGNWSTSEPCVGDTFCKDDYSCSDYVCSPGQKRCVLTRYGSIEVGSFLECSDEGKWSHPAVCPNNAVCRDDENCGEAVQAECRQEDVCKNISGTEIGQMFKCSDSGYVVELCPENKSCTAHNTCGTCTNHETRCKNGTLYTCVDGEWNDGEPCSNRSCADETKCVSCQSTCIEYDSPIGSVSKICEDGLSLVYDCGSNSCNPEKTDCGECSVYQAPRCENDENGVGTVRRCVNGRMTEDAPCDNVSCDYRGSLKCGVCLNGTLKCVDAEDKSYMQVCDGGVFGGAGDVRFECPNNGKCNEEHTACESFTKICIEDANFVGTVLDHEGHVESCGALSCNPDKTDCGDCLISTQSLACSEDADNVGTQTLCVDGKRTDSVCENNASCLAYERDHCGVCRNGDLRCTEDDEGTGIINVCRYALWEGGESPHKYTCFKNTGCGENGCADFKKSRCMTIRDSSYVLFPKIDGYIEYKCERGCGTDNSDCKCSGTDVRCQEDENGVGVLYGCNNSSSMQTDCIWGNGPGGYPKVFKCPGNARCNANGTGCDTDEKTSCFMIGTNGTVGNLVTINNGKYILGDKCPKDTSCTADNYCGECNNDMTPECSNGTITNCIEGKLVKAPCSTGKCASSSACE